MRTSAPHRPVPWLRERLDAVDCEDGMTVLIDTLVERQSFACQRSWFARGRSDPSIRIFRYEDLAQDEVAFLRDLFGYLDVQMSEHEFTGLSERHAFARYAKGITRSPGRSNSASLRTVAM